MTAKIVEFDGITRLDMPPDRILERALSRLESVVVIGYDKDGGEFFASSIADAGTVVWMIERAKSKLLAIPDTL